MGPGESGRIVAISSEDKEVGERDKRGNVAPTSREDSEDSLCGAAVTAGKSKGPEWVRPKEDEVST